MCCSVAYKCVQWSTNCFKKGYGRFLFWKGRSLAYKVQWKLSSIKNCFPRHFLNMFYFHRSFVFIEIFIKMQISDFSSLTEYLYYFIRILKLQSLFFYFFFKSWPSDRPFFQTHLEFVIFYNFEQNYFQTNLMLGSLQTFATYTLKFA